MKKRYRRWFVYAFKGEKLAATFADTLMDLASVQGRLRYRGWRVFQRCITRPMIRARGLK